MSELSEESTKRQSKQVHADGTISWETMADAGEMGGVGDDSDDERLPTAPINVFQKLNLFEPLTSSKYVLQNTLVRRLATGNELRISMLQREGFNRPMCVFDKEGLGIKVPNAASFGINDIVKNVGSRRLLDVMNVNTQTNSSMTMKEWHKYFETPPEQRRDLYNVISLEFSNTKLDNQVH